jgi:adenylosuccinate lyase
MWLIIAHYFTFCYIEVVWIITKSRGYQKKKMNRNEYENPLNSRYASREMKYIFSPDKKFKTWRQLWIALAEAEMELGLNITQAQVDELKLHANDINYEVAEAREKITRHDVMSHVYAYGEQCPNARKIIHLGATSCFVGDNTDIIIMDEGLKLIRQKILKVVAELRDFALKYKNLPTLGFTHFQPAQLVTVGKRATLWIWELLIDLQDIDFLLKNSQLLGCKGTTGTCASFVELFEGDAKKVKKLDELICKKLGYEKSMPVSGQTYSRKIDYKLSSVLSSIAQSAHKFATDMRLLQGLHEVEEPFEKGQIGSSAMAYKRNPMRSERICSLARFAMVNALNPAITAANQWFERTLDDSANKRLAISELFLTVDSILNIYINVADGLVVNEKIIERHINEELPFMATENILMKAVKNGGDRQKLHEKIRVYSMECKEKMKQGEDFDLISKILADPEFLLSKGEVEEIISPKNFTGLCSEQVDDFVKDYVNPILKGADLTSVTAEINA